jgi:uncharacterized membrane protein
VPAQRRLLASVGAGLAAAAVAVAFVPWQVTVLVGWCAGGVTFVGLAWIMVLHSDSDRTRAIATREDVSRVAADLLLLLACVASLVGVGLILLKAASSSGAAEAGMTAVGALSVVVAWAIVHVVYTLRYADVYYSDGGGIDFNQPDHPEYRDFAYLAFTIGMTYQVSDTDLQSKTIRHMALRHALLSYVFGTAIIAVVINIVAGLAR